MKVYQVGGSVRDALLGLPVKDRDFVVVGATPQALLDRGYRPVGRDFPVFLHPETHEEYALARTERKTGRGHQGFTIHASPNVTLEQDLERRDLTINAMARDAAGALIDPFGGQRDLATGLLRHVSAAFAEDPLRVLRVARFAARFGFSVADETMALMRALVDTGELNALSAERVWRELSLGLSAPTPSRMLSVLRGCGALRVIGPEIDALYEQSACGMQPDLGVLTAHALECGASIDATLPARYAILCRHLTVQAIGALSERWRASIDCHDAGRNAASFADVLERAPQLAARDWLALIAGVDALRRPERVEWLLAVVRAYALAQEPDAGDIDAIAARIDGAISALKTVDYSGMKPSRGSLQEAAAARRIDALEQWLRRQAP